MRRDKTSPLCSAVTDRKSAFGGIGFGGRGLVGFGQGVADRADRAAGIVPDEVRVIAVHGERLLRALLDGGVARDGLGVQHAGVRDRDVALRAVFRGRLHGVEHREDDVTAVGDDAGDGAGEREVGVGRDRLGADAVGDLGVRFPAARGGFRAG